MKRPLSKKGMPTKVLPCSLLALNGPWGLFYKTLGGNEHFGSVHSFMSNSVSSTVFLPPVKISLEQKLLVSNVAAPSICLMSLNYSSFS